MQGQPEVGGQRRDLCDEFVSSDFCARIDAGEVDAAVLAPPGGTFPGARQRLPGERSGPPALRGAWPPGIYGFPN